MASSISLDRRISDISISSDLIIGASSFAGLYSSISDEMVNETVKVALNNGFVQFDTAPHYGCGLGEEKLGRALQNVGGERIKVWSKVGRLMLKVDEADIFSMEIDSDNIPGSKKCIFPDAPRDILPVFDYSSNGVVKSYEDSLRRLGFGRLYGLRLHDCESDIAIHAALARYAIHVQIRICLSMYTYL